MPPAFESIVAGTQLEATANKLNEALEAFATTYRQMKMDLPVALERDQLENFATKSYQASVAAHKLALAVEAFIKDCRPSANAG